MRPNMVRIGALEYSIVNESEEANYGNTDIGHLRISVDPKLPEIRQRETLLHEVLHAVTDRYLADDVDERVVRQLSAGLIDWMVANPDALRWVGGLDSD